MIKVKAGITDPYLKEQKISKIHKSRHVTQRGYTSKNTNIK